MTHDDQQQELAAWHKLAWVYQVAIQIGFPILLGISGFFFAELQSHEKTLLGHEKRITTIEAAGWTKADAEADRRRKEAADAQLREVFSDMRVQLAETKTRTESIEATLTRLESRFERFFNQQAERQQ